MKKSVILIAFLLIAFQNFAGTRYYRASFRDDPSTTMVISWADNGTSTNAKIYYGATDLGTNYASYPNNHSIDRTVSHRGMNNRFARLTGLTPNTVYYFVIKDNEGVSSRMTFKTLSDDPNVPILFISGGDTRTGVSGFEFEADKSRERRQRGNSLVGKIRPDFVAFSGDYVFSGTNDGQWSDWFSDWQLTLGSNARLVPVVPVFGNHELSEDIDKLFDVPNSNGFFALTFGGNLMRLYNLNSELECDNSQLDWLTNDLQMHTNTSSETHWKSIQYHIPLVPHGEYSPSTTMISCWTPLFQTYKVRLAMEGHSHVEKITWPVVPSSASGSDNGFIRNDSQGTVYAGEGCWGAPLRNLYTYHSSEAAFNWTRNQGKFAGFFLVKVTKQKIQIQTVKFHEATDVTNVGQVAQNDPAATLPSGLTYWVPSNGQVVEILNTNVYNNNADLLNLTTSQGTLNPTFNPSTLTYQVQLPYGSTQVPTISATTSDAEAVVYLTQASSINGTQQQRTANALVIAEDGSTTKNYTVEFSVAPQSDAFLATLVPSQGVLNPSFTGTTLNYSVVLPAGTTNTPTVTATASDPNSSVQITQATSVNGTAIILVTSSDNTNENTYTVTFSTASSNAKEILNFVIPNQTGNSIIDNTASTVVVTMPIGTDVTALIPNISISGVSVNPASGVAQNFTNSVIYTVTATDNSTKQYTVSIELSSVNNDATLILLEANLGSLNPSFDPQLTSYTCDLPTGTNSVIITAQTNDPNANKNIYPPSNLQGTTAQRTGAVLVKASDNTTTKVYTIVFDVLTAINEYNKSNIAVYPNPTQDYVTVKSDYGYNNLKRIEIYNGIGHKLQSYNSFNGESIKIDLSEYSSGAYYVYIITENDILNYKILKTK